MSTIDVVALPFHTGGLHSAVDSVLALCTNTQAKGNHIVTATGAHGIVTSRQDSGLFRVLSGAYLNLPDGMPIVWLGRAKGAKGMSRCYGPDFFLEAMRLSADQAVNHYLCGGKEGVAKELQKRVTEKCGHVRIVGTFSPPFREMTEDELKFLGSEIDRVNTDIVWIGLSTPKQEVFAGRLAEYTHVHFLVTIGAAFDFHTGRLRQSPRFLQRAGLEWVFRIFMEPTRLLPRYVKVVPKFILLAVADLCKSAFRLKH
jgi:N-acetylglucosaminyldiphosphoundecaprenol N-acetyl-beta-D-mannosaminyltransferase